MLAPPGFAVAERSVAAAAVGRERAEELLAEVDVHERDEDELVDALAELLIEWLELRPERLPVAVGPSGASALVSGLGREEEG